MTHVAAVETARPLHRPVMHRKDYRLALRQRDDLGTRLHARPLLGHDKLSAGEIGARSREQNRDLQRKYVLAVEVLMEAIVVAGTILQEKRRGLCLSRLAAERQ